MSWLIGHWESFFHLPSLIIVLGGTCFATMVHFPLKQFYRMLISFSRFLRYRRVSSNQDTLFLTQLTAQLKAQGRLSLNSHLNSIDDPFIQRGLRLLIDGMSVDYIRSVLADQLTLIRHQHQLNAQCFDYMARYAPGFGLIGTLIGLIMMLSQLEDPSSLGPTMSIAFITTFYGVVFANVLFAPIAGRLRIFAQDDLARKQLYLDTFLGLAKQESQYLIQEKLSSRLDKVQSFPNFKVIQKETL